jgi:SAM-dependent methyltransferase
METIKKLIRLLPKGVFRIFANLLGVINSQFYRGNKVKCNCCDKTFRRFMNYRIRFLGIQLFKNNPLWFSQYRDVLCPNCMSQPYHRLLPFYFETHPVNDNSMILIYSSEHCTEKYFCNHGYKYSLADLFDSSTDFQEDIQHSHFPDETWDIIVCNQILEHVPDYKAALLDLKRIVKRNGIVAITVPVGDNLETTFEDPSVTSPEERIKLFGQHDHLRLFGSDFKLLLAQAGFEVEVVDGNHAPPEYRIYVGPFNFSDNHLFICTPKPDFL